ncbi:MAG TPA: efflux RND transporter periplasmic adaptor subunit [Gemmataceae bacterium]|nr:efflux RND transporter periplasmic adaptor subunit [Gemmataceae bacterium]
MSFSSFRRGRATLLLVIIGLAALAGCRQAKQSPPAPPPPDVTVAKPVWRQVQNYREYTGYLEPVETVNVRTRIRGFLRKIHFTEGAEVKKGDLLYEIDPREFEAAVARTQADLTKANAELGRAKADEDRGRVLVRTMAISEEEFQQRVATRKSAEASVAQAEAALRIAKLDLEFTKITAPISGRISRTQVTEGNLVGFNEPTLLTTIVRLDPLYVTFDVPEANAVEYERRAREQNLPSPVGLKIPLELGVARETGYAHAGTIDFLENRVDPGSGTIRLRGVLDNKDRVLVPGLFARVRVPLGPPQRLLAVPEVALMSDQAGRFVFVVTADSTVRRQQVAVDGRSGELTAVETGLTADDWVIVNGLQKARPGGQVNPIRTDLDAPKEPAKK